MKQLGERALPPSDSLAHAGAPLDARYEAEEARGHGEVPVYSMGLERRRLGAKVAEVGMRKPIAPVFPRVLSQPESSKDNGVGVKKDRQNAKNAWPKDRSRHGKG